jgi:hypothetical protein
VTAAGTVGAAATTFVVAGTGAAYGMASGIDEEHGTNHAAVISGVVKEGAQAASKMAQQQLANKVAEDVLTAAQKRIESDFPGLREEMDKHKIKDDVPDKFSWGEFNWDDVEGYSELSEKAQKALIRKLSEQRKR